MTISRFAKRLGCVLNQNILFLSSWLRGPFPFGSTHKMCWTHEPDVRIKVVIGVIKKTQQKSRFATILCFLVRLDEIII